MRYKKQQLDIPFVRGVDESIDPRVQRAGGFATAHNVILQKPGRAAKRPAFFDYGNPTNLSSVTIGTDTRKIADRGGNLVLLNTDGIYERVEDLDKFMLAGPCPEAGYPERTVISRSASSNQKFANACENGDYRVVVWVDTASSLSWEGDLWAAVYDISGTLLFREAIDTGGTASNPKVAAIGGNIVVAWRYGTTPFNIKTSYVDLSSIPSGFSTPNVLYSATLTVETSWDLCGGEITGFAVIYDTAGGQIRVDGIDDTGAATALNTTMAYAPDEAMGAHSDGTNLWIGYSASGSRYYAVLLCSDLSVVLAPTQLVAGGYVVAGRDFSFANIGAPVSGTAVVVWTEINQVAFPGVESVRVASIDTAGNVDLGEELKWAATASRLAKWDNKFYAVLSPQVTVESAESAYYLCEIPTQDQLPRIVAVVSKLATAAATRYWSSNLLVDGNRVTWAGDEIYTFEDSLFGTTGVSLWNIEMEDPNGQTTVTVGDALWISGGVVSKYDGVHVAEVGFANSPQDANVTPTAGTKTWIYAFSYVWPDNEGLLHESALGPITDVSGSLQVGVTASSAATPVTLDVQPLTLTNRQRGGVADTPQGNAIAIRVYRTQDNSPVLQFVGDYEQSRHDYYTTITDSMDDSTLAARPAAYTEGAMPFGRPVASRGLALFDSRMVAAADSGAVFTSQSSEDRAQQFYDSPTHSITTRDGGPTVAVAALDDSLVMLKSDRAYLQTGAGGGPGPNGVPLYPQPSRLPFDGGCANPLSLAITPAGLAFESQVGMVMLPRGFGGGSLIGKKIEDTLALFPRITGSVVLHDKSLAVWSATNESYSRLLAFDYAIGEWVTWGIGETDLEPYGTDLTTIGMVGTTMWTAAGSSLSYEYGYDHANSGEGFVSTTLTSEKIRPSDLITGYARVSAIRILGEYSGACKLTVEANIDEGGWGYYSRTWTLPDESQTAGVRILKEWIPPVQKCDTIEIRISDSSIDTPTPTSGVTFHSLTLDVAARQNGRPLHSKARG